MHSQGAMHAVPTRHAFSPQPIWSKARHTSSCDEEIYIQGVSGAIVGNPDTIYDEATTQQQTPPNFGIVPARESCKF